MWSEGSARGPAGKQENRAGRGGGAHRILPSRGSRQKSGACRCARKAGNPFQTTQWNRLSCRDQEVRLEGSGTVERLHVRSERGLLLSRMFPRQQSYVMCRDRRGDSTAWSGRGSQPSGRTSGPQRMVTVCGCSCPS